MAPSHIDPYQMYLHSTGAQVVIYMTSPSVPIFLEIAPFRTSRTKSAYSQTAARTSVLLKQQPHAPCYGAPSFGGLERHPQPPQVVCDLFESLQPVMLA